MEDNQEEVRVRVLNVREQIQPAPDAFAISGEDLKDITGMNPSVRRKMTREFQKFHRGRAGAESKTIGSDHITGYSTFEVITPPHNLDYLAKLYELSSPHYAAVNAKVANIVGLGFDFVESDATKDALESVGSNEKKLKRARKKVMAAKRELLEWLESLNEEDDFAETLRKVWVDYEATGNGYLEIGRTRSGEIGYIGHASAINIRVRQRRDGFVEIVGREARFFRNFGDRETPNPVGDDTNPNELIHFKKYSPTNTYYGVPDVIAAQTSIAGNEFAARFNLDYFENKAVPRYILTVKGAKLSESAETRLLEFFETGLKGQHHRSLYIPLPPDRPDSKVEFKMDAIEADVQDASFTKYKDGNRDEILMAHRVPITKVSLAAGTNLAVARDADKNFKEQVCRPEQRIVEKKVGRIFKEKTDMFIFKLNELTLTDEDTQSKIDERYLKNKTITPNEVRARKGMPALAGGDKPIELSPQRAAEARANRARDAERSANAPDVDGEARNPKGEGRQVG